jgi:hypothetical protein
MNWHQAIQSTIWILLPVVPWSVSFLVRKKLKGFMYFLLVVTISSLLMSSVVIALTAHLNWQLEQQTLPMDRNEDGVYSPDEEVTWTPDEKRAMQRMYADGGRNLFAAIFFPTVSVVYSLVVSFVVWTYNFLSNRRKSRS